MIALTELEHKELEDHFRQCPDLWTRSPDNIYLWIRADEDTPLCAVKFMKADLEGTPIFTAQAVALDWDQEKSDGYLEDLINSWTSANVRKKIQNRISGMKADSELVSMAVQTEMFKHPEIENPPDLPEGHRLSEGAETFLIQGGGYLKLKIENGHVHAVISIPSDRKHGGYGPPISGFLTGTLRMHAPGRLVL